MSEQLSKRSMQVTELEPPLPKASLFIWIICIQAGRSIHRHW